MTWLAVMVLATGACALAGDAVVATPSPFRGIRSLLLVRSAEERGQRAKDPLDGLDESLRARGFATRVVDLEPRRAELADVGRLFEQLEARAAARPVERTARPVTFAADAGALVERLGVDAVATYHRLDRRRGSELAAPPPLPGSPIAPPPAPGARATGAFVVADRAGSVQTFAWGGAEPLDAASPLNAAEAIELLVAALTGERRDE